MNLTLLTATCDRPEAFRLAEAYVARQTVQPFQWIVVDDGTEPAKCTLGQEYIYLPHLRGPQSMVNKVKHVLDANLIKGDALVFWEDDDFYSSTWLAFCATNLARYDLVGEGRAIYYNVQQRYWFEHINLHHASLCSTAVKRSLFPVLARVCASINHAYIDDPLWKAAPISRKRVFDPGRSPHLVVGIKAMPGKKGYGGGHSGRDAAARDDADLSQLKKFIGEDAENYAEFYNAKAVTPAPAAQANIAKSECGRVHGPNWLKWLAPFQGKPDVCGMELGCFKGESAQWMLDNICTHADSRYFCIDAYKPYVEYVGLDLSTVKAEAETRLTPYGARVAMMIGDSNSFLRSWDRQLLDFIYVDAGHDAQNVLRDAVLAWEILKVGGVMIFDDLNWGDPKKPMDRPLPAIEGFVLCYGKQLKVLGRGMQLAAQKIA